jgi:predicted Zn-dependent peptidase
MVEQRESYSKIILDNGFVVVLQNTSTKTIAAKLRVNYGSMHEKKGEEGIAHFLEHCLASAGSKKYSPSKADEIQGLFGYFNAETSIDKTKFEAYINIEDLDSWLDLVSDHVFRPRFNTERINLERDRVLQEISDDKSDPAYAGNILFDDAFYRGHPKGRCILGKEIVLSGVDKEKLEDFHSRGYAPNNMDLILVGGLPNNVMNLVENYFGHIKPGKKIETIIPKLNQLDKKTILHISSPELINVDDPKESSAIIQIKYVGPVMGHEDERPTRTMNIILGGDGCNASLYHNISLNKGLAYDIGTVTDGYRNAGELEVQASVNARRLEESLDAIFNELQKMKTYMVDEKALDRVRRMAKFDVARMLESNKDRLFNLEEHIDYGWDAESFIAAYDAITPEKVLEMANKYLPNREDGKYVLYIRDPLKK